MTRVILITFFIYFNTALGTSLSFGDGNTSTTEEILLKKMPTPNIIVIQDRTKVKECELIKEFKPSIPIEFWQKKEDICAKLITYLKKKTYLSKGNTLLFLESNKGCPGYKEASSFICKLTKEN